MTCVLANSLSVLQRKTNTMFKLTKTVLLVMNRLLLFKCSLFFPYRDVMPWRIVIVSFVICKIIFFFFFQIERNAC